MALRHRVGWDAEFCRRSPLFWPLSAAAAPLRDHADWPDLASLNALYAGRTAHDDQAALRFSSNVRKQDKRADGKVVLSALYDARISVAQEVPTRERDWHDLLNALCFATFPRSKRALHARQYRALSSRVAPDARGLPGRRSPEQDALTLFDEGGLVLAAEPREALQLMAATDQERSELFRQLLAAERARVVPFGHALFEHLVEGLRCPAGCTQVVAIAPLWSPEVEFLERLDCALAAALAEPTRFVSARECSHVRFDVLQL
jgi:hypothetical protein